MTLDDPVSQAIYETLTMLPAIDQAIGGLLSDRERSVDERKMAAVLQQRVKQRSVFSLNVLNDLTQLLFSLNKTQGAVTQEIWLADEHCMSGGWWETVVVPEQEERQERYFSLMQFQKSLRHVADLNDAYRIACRIMN